MCGFSVLLLYSLGLWQQMTSVQTMLLLKLTVASAVAVVTVKGLKQIRKQHGVLSLCESGTLTWVHRESPPLTILPSSLITPWAVCLKLSSALRPRDVDILWLMRDQTSDIAFRRVCRTVLSAQYCQDAETDKRTSAPER